MQLGTRIQAYRAFHSRDSSPRGFSFSSGHSGNRTHLQRTLERIQGQSVHSRSHKGGLRLC